MVRSYVADAKVQDILNNLSSSGDGSLPLVGLIIGQFSDQRDYVLHLMRTPILDWKSRDASAADGDNEVIPSKKHLHTGKASSLEVVLEKSLCVHARQVRQMLTGGLDVMGMFVHSSSDDFKTSQLKYKQLLCAIFKVVGKFDFLLPKSKPSEVVLLHVCSNTKRLSCRSLDIGDNKRSFVPAELKFQKLLDSFVGLKTEFSLRTSIYVREEDMTHGLERQIISGLNPIIKSICEAVPVVNGNVLCDDDDDDDDSLSRKPMDSFKRTNKTRKPVKKNSRDDDEDEDDDDDDDDDDESIKVDLLRNYSVCSDEIPSRRPSAFKCGAKIVANGTISCRAFVHGRSTLLEGIQALKLDIIRSLLTRCELVCQDLLQGEEDQDIRAVYETPIRAFASLHGSPVRLSDYLFQDETSSDSLGRFREVLDMDDVEEGDVDQSQETVPVAEDFDEAESILKSKDALFAVGSNKNDEYLKSNGTSWTEVLRPFISIPFSVLVASVASLTASYWYLGQNFYDDR